MANRETSTGQTHLMRHTAINGWTLFWLITLPMTVFMVNAMRGFDVSGPEGVSHMIQYSVRWAVPFIYCVVAASAMPVLFPGEFGKWWMRNRKHIGLVFAVAMAWQGAFIFIMSSMHTGYYYEDVYALRDESEGSSGYLFLVAMVITSFSAGRRLISSAQWKVLHKCGTYFLWAYPFSVYWWNLYYYEAPEPIDYVFYWAGFLAFALRIAAWGKKRRLQAMRTQGDQTSAGALWMVPGLTLIILGLVASATGLSWQEPVTGLLTSAAWSANLEIWFPFWPFEPFLPLMVMALGTLMVTHYPPVQSPRRESPLATT